MRPIAATIAVLILAPPLWAADLAKTRWGVETATLANGLEVIVVPQQRMPAIHHLLMYKVGSTEEEPGKTGLAHYLEHLMFKGTEKTPPGAFDALVNRHGGRQNAFTSADYTGYFQTMPRDQLGAMMALEADRMAGLKLSEANSRPELSVVLEERNQRVNAPPGGRLSEKAAAALFPDHPYGRPVIGWEADIKTLTYQDALAFHARWYAPNNAVLIVAGDTDLSEVLRLADATYGRVTARALPPRVALPIPAAPTDRKLTEVSARAPTPAWSARAIGPSLSTVSPDEAAAMAVLIDGFGQGLGSRLDRTLVNEQRLAQQALAGVDLSRRGPGQIFLSASPAPGVDLDRLETAFLAEVGRVQREGLSETEVNRAIERLTNGEAFERDSLTGLANSLGRAKMIGRTPDDVAADDDRIRRVTPAEVRQSAARWFNPAAFVITHLLPKAAP
ncbi:peptidase M16 [Elstera cyanobacteriorum]|uniref:Peptidase M16 n=1 Tax=Elstera cyanobacteriorum TaxID=2022747 RepID=A0A255XUJ1_9PROT|nr:pitrilysin family protein [Elstera cyanobacteriorum]OYQ19910.1 hypothetical protein CHR90_07275 [Elstera cyanobacteriorum]GFZ96467.1 peptidase M16 [Elstera cyanobacteriorum]